MALTPAPMQPDGGNASRIAARVVLVIGVALVTAGIGDLILFGLTASPWYLIAGWGVLLLVVYAFLEPETVRAFLGQGQLHAGARALLTTLMVLAAVVIINIVVKDRLADKQFDMSKGQVNSLAPQTLKVLQQLDQPVTATAWYSKSSSEVDSAYQLLQRYHDINHRLTVQRYSSQDRPDLFKQQGAANSSIVIQYANRQPQVLTDQTEQGLTTALLGLVTGHSPKLYFLTGHGEGSLDASTSGGVAFSNLKTVLQGQGITAVALNLAASANPGVIGPPQTSGSPSPAASPDATASPSPAPSGSPAPAAGGIPADADAVALLDPQIALGDSEVAALQAYLDKGGRLLVSNLHFAQTNLGKLVSKYGLKFGGGVVLDQQMQLSQTGSAAVLVVQSYGSSPVTQALSGELSVVALMGSVGGTASTGYTLTPIAATQSDACERTDSANHSGACGTADTKGPFNLIVTVEQTGATSGKPTRVVAMGGASWISDSVITAYNTNGNRDLATGIVNWLVGQEKLTSIAPRQASPSTIFLTDAQRAIVFPGFFLFVPVLIGIAGLTVWLRNRD